MPEWSPVDRSHVLAALEEHDRLGSREFLSRYGFRRTHAYTLWHRGEEYDAAAVLGVAYLHATGRPATRDDVPGGAGGAATALVDLGFDVVVDEEAATLTRTRATPRAEARAPRPEPVVSVCPRCHVALPATGVCDFCD